MKQLHKVYIAVGTNLGDKYQNIYDAYKLIQNQIGNITSKSHIYITKPWGFNSTSDFYNSVIEVYTYKTPKDLLTALKHIENKMGRKPKMGNQYESRVIDLDILSFEDIIINSEELTIPHPHIEKRNFVYYPFLDVCLNWINPKTKVYLKTINKDENIKKFTKKKD